MSEAIPGVRHVIAVASGKGGVGKSTVAVHLALALQQLGARVGLVDADILGPSIPTMLGLTTGERPSATPDGRIIPPVAHGLPVVSMGLLTGEDNPAVLRGPMVSKYLQLFVRGVEWGPLDHLVLDLPPGTGDTQLTLAQTLPLSGAVIVTTPQVVSLRIARRGLRMFESVHVPILGVVENMASDVFGHGGGEAMSRELGVPFLGSIPLDADIVVAGDEGRPLLVERPSSPVAQQYLAIAKELTDRLEASTRTAVPPFQWTWETDEGAPAWNEGAVRPDGSPTTPVGLRRRDARTLSVLWEDGQVDDLDVRDLRLACRCAACIEETSGRPLLDPALVRPDVAPLAVTDVGNYAVNVRWNDGHDTGIYTFTLLRTLGEASGANEVEDV